MTLRRYLTPGRTDFLPQELARWEREMRVDLEMPPRGYEVDEKHMNESRRACAWERFVALSELSQIGENVVEEMPV